MHPVKSYFHQEDHSTKVNHPVHNSARVESPYLEFRLSYRQFSQSKVSEQMIQLELKTHYSVKLQSNQSQVNMQSSQPVLITSIQSSCNIKALLKQKKRSNICPSCKMHSSLCKMDSVNNSPNFNISNLGEFCANSLENWVKTVQILLFLDCYRFITPQLVKVQHYLPTVQLAVPQLVTWSLVQSTPSMLQQSLPQEGGLLVELLLLPLVSQCQK